METSPQKQKEQRQKQLDTDKLVTTEFWNLKINIFTWKGFEQCVREETAHLTTLKSKVVNLLKETAEIETNYQRLLLLTLLPLNYFMVLSMSLLSLVIGVISENTCF